MNQPNSTRDEKIIGRSKQHPAIFVMPMIPFLFCILFLIFASNSSFPLLYYLSSLAFFFTFLYGLAKRSIEYFTTEFELTNKRLIVRTGLLRRRELELLLTQVESIDIDKPLLGRLLDYGTVRIVGTGGTSQNIKSLKYPTKIRNAVLRLLSEQS